MKKVKIINEIIHSCDKCPYADWWAAENGPRLAQDGWMCYHDDGEGFIISDKEMIEKNIDSIPFPSWCPLAEKEDPGVRTGVKTFIFRNGKILLQKRKNTQTVPNQWDIPGGKIEYGETPEDALVREIKEETDISVNIDDIYFLTYKNTFFKEANQHYITLFFLITKNEGDPINKETEIRQLPPP